MVMRGLVSKVKTSFSYYKKYLQLRRNFSQYQKQMERTLQRLRLTIEYQNQKIALIEKKLAELEQKRDSTEILLKVLEAISPQMRKN